MEPVPGKPEVLSREMVRPSTRTPDRLRKHSLSFFDQMAPPFYVPLLYLYRNHDRHDSTSTPAIDNRTRLLKLSLSEALSTYYPLAGTTTTTTTTMGGDNQDPLTVQCNDEGVVFLQARMKADLTSIASHPGEDHEASLRLLFPDDLAFRSTTLSSPLVVQVTGFECGGMALAVCASHKILDMSSFCSFVNHWAAVTAASGGRRIEQPQAAVRFDLATLFPPVDVQVTKTFDPPNVKTVCKRFVFDGPSIAKLKAMMTEKKIENPARVEVVLALICSSAISAPRTCCLPSSSDVSGSGSRLQQSTFLTQAVNLRPRLTSPPSITNSIGNLSSIFAMSIAAGLQMDLVRFVSMIRKVKTEYFDTCDAEYSRRGDFRSFIVETTKVFRDASGEEAAKVYISSSWCNFPLYEADFGWGKPVRVTTAAQEMKDTIVLLDTGDGGGVEALVCLEEREMAAFQCDEMVRAFADHDSC